MSWSPGPDIHVRVVTEDGSEHAHDTISHLVRRMLQLIEPGFLTNRLKTVRLLDTEERHAARATCWQAETSNDLRIVKKLVRTIATDLLAGRFVVVHADGDEPWSKRPSKNERAFGDYLRLWVHQAIGSEEPHPRTPRRPQGPKTTRTPEEIERLLARMFLLMPYYTIESWLYQNTEVAIRICHEKHQGKDAHTFREWQSNRASLDEMGKSELKAICLGKDHNLVLASEQYPAHEVDAAGASFHTAVEVMRGSTDLKNTLSDSPK